MSNPFYYLFGLLLLLSYPTGLEPLTFVRPEAVPERTIPMAAAGALLFYLLLTVSCFRRLESRGAHHAAGLARALLKVGGLVLFGVLIHVFHFPLWIWSLGLEGNLFLRTLLALAPLFGFYSILALAGADYERRRRGALRVAGLAFAFRSFLGLSFLPVVSMLSLEFLFHEIEALERLAYVYPFVGWVAVVLWILVLLTCLPLLLRLAFAGRPMEPGPLRDRLVAVCRSVGFRFSELLVVRTGPLRMANAFIVGLGAPWRYVFFTDAIVEGMRPEELECVLAHEIVHSTKGHMRSYFYFTVGFMLAGALGLELVSEMNPAVVSAVFLAWGVLYWFVGFGFVSRRFETEADLVASRLAPAPEGATGPYRAARGMADALEKVADLNGAPLRGWSWRHFDIATRMSILLDAEVRPERGEAFERFCGRIRRAAGAILIAGCAGAVILAWSQASRAGEARARLEAYARVDEGSGLQREGRFEAAAAEYRAGLSAGADHPEIWLRLADCERRAGREKEAREAEGQARRKGIVDPRSRLRLDGLTESR